MEYHNTISKRLTPALSGFLIGVAILFIGFFLIFTQFKVLAQDEEAETREVLDVIEQNFQYAIREVNSIALLLAQAVQDDGSVKDFDETAKRLTDNYPSISVLEIILDGIVTHVYPLEGYEELLGYDLYQNERIKKELEKAEANDEIYFSGPSRLLEGELGIIGLLPFKTSGNDIKTAAVILYLDTFLELSQISNFADRYNFQLSKINLASGEEEFFIEYEHDHIIEWENEAHVLIKEGDWKLYAHKATDSYYPVYLISLSIICIFLAVLIGFLSYKIFLKPFELEKLLVEQADELLKSREEFRKNSELLASVLESPQNMVIFSLDRFYNYIAFNENHRKLAEELFGIPIKEGMNVFDVVPKKSRALLMVNYNRALNGESFEFSQSFVGPDRETHHWQNWFSPIRDKNQNIIGLTVFSVDITQRIKAEMKLEQNESRLRTLISNSPYCIHELDVEGRLISINKAGAKMFNLESPEQLIGRYYPVMIGKKHAVLVNDLLTKTLMGEASEFEFSTGDSHFQSLMIPIKNEDDVVVRVMGITQDITERKESEEIIENSLREKTTLLTEIHHRVKNNLAIVSGLLELQKVEVDDERLTAIFNQSINRIISIAMVHELMYNTDDLSSVNVQAYLEKLIPAISATMQNKKQNVEIDLNIVEYKLNINQAIPLGLLLNELITNSFKYAFNGGADNKISIDIDSDENGMKVVYKDNGRGFPNEVEFETPKNLGLNLIHAQLQQLDAEYRADTKNQFMLDFNFMVQRKGSHSNFNAPKASLN